MREFIKKFESAILADGYVIKDIPFTTSVATDPIQNLVCNETGKHLENNNGIVIICATLDKKTKEILAKPEVLTRGFIYVKESAQLIDEMKRISLEVIEENILNNYVEYNKIKVGIRERLSNYLYEETECKPMIITVVQEV